MTANGEAPMDRDAASLSWLDELRRRVVEVDAWAHRRWRADDLAHSTRAPVLSPARPGADASLVTAATVEEVARRRAAMLLTEPPSDREVRGRLLAFDREMSLSDGAAAVESRGFFDDDNTPPWDCWLVFVVDKPRSPGRWSPFDSYVLCWIPASLVDVVTRAAQVNPEDCLRWADELQSPWLEQITRAGGRLPGIRAGWR
jgi:hypothetical protein